jgi:phosphatidylinositol alpha-1,6-mannosyltransferase
MAVVVLTPNVTGCDGISHLSRLIVRAFNDVQIIALHESTSLPSFEHAAVSGAGGRNARFAAIALQYAATSGPDVTVIVVHLHLAPAALAFAARGAALATCLCGIEAWAPLTWAQRAMLRSGGAVFAISAYTVERFRKVNPRFDDLQITVCHPGIERCASAAWSAAPTPPSALIVGRMAARERYKGHDALLEAWPEVSSHLAAARLDVIGDGDDRDRLESRARSLGLADVVTFHGRVSESDLQRRYRSCTVLAMPSRDEGFGLVYIEAMRAGRACIASPGAASEIVDHGRTGLIVPPDDPPALASALISILSDRLQAKTMGENGLARFLNYFTEEHFRRRVIGIVPPPAVSRIAV